MRAGVLTVSDKGSRGERADESGQVIRAILEQEGVEVTHYNIVPDELDQIRTFLKEWSDTQGLDLILTTGGTGLSTRDVTPEATVSILERTAPGISEAIRAQGMRHTMRAMLSRGTAGVRCRTLIVNLPGSVKAARESLEKILPALFHGVEILQDGAAECGSNSRIIRTEG